MPTDADQKIWQLENAYDFYPGANPAYTTGRTTKTVDELVHVLPFEKYERNILGGVVASNTDIVSTFPTASTFLSTADPSSFALDVEDQNDSKDQFDFQRIGVTIALDRLQAEVSDKRKAQNQVRQTVAEVYTEMAAAAVLRELGRQLTEGDGTAPNIEGLSYLYDGNSYKSGSDTQVLTANGGAGGATTLPEIRRLIRRVTPSEQLTGAHADALFGTLRMRDELVRLEIAGGVRPEYKPDKYTGKTRYHHNGLPFFTGPFDEDEGATESPPVTDAWSSLYAVKLEGPCGIRVLHSQGDPSNFGIRVEKIETGTASNKLYYHVFGYYTLYIPEHVSVARLRKINLSNEAD